MDISSLAAILIASGTSCSMPEQRKRIAILVHLNNTSQKDG